MAEVKVVVKNSVEGKRQISEQAEQWKSLKKTIGNVTGAFGLVAAGMATVWKVAEQGAALELSADRFDKLTASIGTTSAALMDELGAATGDMMTNAGMMASASQIISLGLADTQEGVVDLASLVSELGWDMSQVILTFANNSKMRLDALGLSVTDVEERMAELEAQGYDTDKAFDMAVIQAGQAKLELLGSAAGTSAGGMKELTANIGNMVDSLKIAVSDGIQPSVDALNILFDVANNGGAVIGGIIDSQIAEAGSVEELTALYEKLNAQRGLGALVTGTTGDIVDNMDKVREAIYEASGSADEYAKAIAAMGIPGIEANRITEEMTAALYDAAMAEYEATTREKERVEVLERANRWAEANTTANQRMASQYSMTTTATEDLTMSVAAMNYHQEEAYEGMVNSTAVLDANRAALAESKTAYDEARDAAQKFAEQQDAITQQRTQDFLRATTSALVEWTTTATYAGGRTQEQEANFQELSTAAERIRDNIRSLSGGTAGLGLNTEELNKKLEDQYEKLAAVEGAMGPLADIQREVTSSSSGWSVNIDLLNGQMTDYIINAKGSAEETGLWMVATGEMSKTQYEAAMQTLIMQESMKALAEQYADGEISLGDLQEAMDDLVAGSPYAAEAEIDTKDSEERMRRLSDILDNFNGRHVRATATVDTSGPAPDPGKGGEDKPDPAAGSGAYAAGTGGWVTVPPGYPNDTYNARLTSGEQFAVIPAGGGKAGMGMTVNISFAGAIFQGTTQQQAAQITETVANRLGRLS